MWKKKFHAQIYPMGAVETMQILLSFAVRLQTGLPLILTLNNNDGTQPLAGSDWSSISDLTS